MENYNSFSVMSKNASPLGGAGFRLQVSSFRFLFPFNFQLLLFRYRAVWAEAQGEQTD